MITYPGGVYGPHDPHYGGNCKAIEGILRGTWSVVPRGGALITDVRDLAALHVAVLERGRGPRRYLATAQRVSLSELAAIVARVTGRQIATREMSAGLLLGPLRLLEVASQALSVRLPATYHSMYVAFADNHIDDNRTRSELGLTPRPVEETLTDMIRWMVDTGRVSPTMAGRLVAQPPDV